MKKLEEEYPGNDFYFICGSDLVPGLERWDCGKGMIEDVKFVLFDRKGHEDILEIDPSKPKTYRLPLTYLRILGKDNLIGMVSSTEVR